MTAVLLSLHRTDISLYRGKNDNVLIHYGIAIKTHSKDTKNYITIFFFQTSTSFRGVCMTISTTFSAIVARKIPQNHYRLPLLLERIFAPKYNLGLNTH